MTRPHRLIAAAALALSCAAAQAADPIKILFVGNSYTFGRVDPVLRYNAANVHDLTAAFYAADPTGSNVYEPHPWGGVPGIFKKLTDEAGLNYDVSISARNAATLRGQFLNTASSAWDLRGNVASQQWGVVVLQEQSDAALPAGRGKNANLPQFQAYANQFEKFIHNGAAQSYTENQLYASIGVSCASTGATSSTCGTTRNIPANPNASAATQVYLTETWARPDMVYAHKVTTPDPNSSSGSPIVASPTSDATTYYATLGAMTTDLHKSFADEAAANGHFAGVIPVGDAFQLAYDLGLVKTSGFYDANGVFVPNAAGDAINLWWDDYLHASKYGSYLDALVQFGTITGLDPLSLGGFEQAASDLGISSSNALILERVASTQLGFAVAAVPEPSTWALTIGGLALLGWRARRATRA